jgi:hypothetical protein
VGVVGVGEHVADGDAGLVHALVDGDERSGRVDVTGHDEQLAGQFGHGGRSLRRPWWRLGVIAVEQFIVDADGVGGPMPQEASGLAPGWSVWGQRPGLVISPVDGGRSRRACSAQGWRLRSQGIDDVGEGISGAARGGASAQDGHYQGEGALDLVVGEGMRPCSPADDDAEAAPVGGGSPTRARWTRTSWPGRSSAWANSIPTSRVRAPSWWADRPLATPSRCR